MRRLARIFCAALAPLCVAQTNEEKNVIATAQKLFDAMLAHDADAARAIILPEGRLAGANDEGKVTSMTLEAFAARLPTIKGKMLERMWNPKVQISGRIAHLWADYDFHLDGKFNHCGIDSFSFVKAADGWKIVSVEDTRETTGCQPSPLGPPNK